MPYLVSAKDANTGDKLSMEDVVDAAGHLRFDPEELVLKIENRMPPVEHQRGQQNMDLMNLSHTNKFHSVELDGYWHRFDDSDILRSSARRSHTLILGNAVISDLVLILQDDQTIQNLKTLEYFENDVNRESFISYEGEGRRVVETLASELKQLAQLQKLAFHNIPISIQTLYSALNDNDYGSGLKCDVKKLCLHRCEIAMMQKTNVESEILASSFGLRIILPPNMNLVPGNAEKEQSIWTDSRDDPEAKWVKNTTVTELHWSGTNDKRWDWEWPPFAVVGALLDGFANLKRLTLERCGLHKLDGLIPYLSAEDCKLECLDVQYNDLDCEAMMDFFFRLKEMTSLQKLRMSENTWEKEVLNDTKEEGTEFFRAIGYGIERSHKLETVDFAPQLPSKSKAILVKHWVANYFTKQSDGVNDENYRFPWAQALSKTKGLTLGVDKTFALLQHNWEAIEAESN